jgi:alkyl hydroperoxide reductase subunit AhpF
VSLLSPADSEKLRDAFAEMTAAVRLLFFTQTFGCDTCDVAQEILNELPALSEKIAVEEVNLVLEQDQAKRYGVDRAPAIVLLGQDAAGGLHDSRIRFLGAPSGYEFVSLVQAILLVGGRESSLQPASLEKLAGVHTPLTLQVFTTPT